MTSVEGSCEAPGSDVDVSVRMANVPGKFSAEGYFGAGASVLYRLGVVAAVAVDYWAGADAELAWLRDCYVVLWTSYLDESVDACGVDDLDWEPPCHRMSKESHAKVPGIGSVHFA